VFYASPTPKIQVILTDIWDGYKPTGWDLDFTDITTVTIAEEFKEVSLWEIINRACNLVNYEFWYDPKDGSEPERVEEKWVKKHVADKYEDAVAAWDYMLNARGIQLKFGHIRVEEIEQ